MSGIESSPSRLGKITRLALGVVVLAAAVGVVLHEMGLWQVSKPDDPAAVAKNRTPPALISGRTVTVLGGGSILPTPELGDQARRDGTGTAPDFGPILAAARPAVSSADLALCHLDGSLGTAGGDHQATPELAAAIADAGFDGCSTAGPQAFEQGMAGVESTLDALDDVKLRHSGTNRSEEQSTRPTIYTANGVKVAHLSYTMTVDGPKVPADSRWAVARPTTKRIKAAARAAREAGAAIVVVSIGWGSPGEPEPDVDQQRLARSIATMQNVDIVLGHGAHIVQPAEQIDGKWILYGLGDMAARHPQPTNDNREGSMIRITFTPVAGSTDRWQVAAVEALPTFIDNNPAIRVVDLEQALVRTDLPVGRRSIYEAAIARIQGHLLNRGGGVDPFRVRGALAK